jgi:hypothetical protein
MLIINLTKWQKNAGLRIWKISAIQSWEWAYLQSSLKGIVVQNNWIILNEPSIAAIKCILCAIQRQIFSQRILPLSPFQNSFTKLLHLEHDACKLMWIINYMLTHLSTSKDGSRALSFWEASSTSKMSSSSNRESLLLSITDMLAFGESIWRDHTDVNNYFMPHLSMCMVFEKW